MVRMGRATRKVIMAKFSYLVTIEVSDDDLVPSDDNIREFYEAEAEDEVGSFSPATLAMIVMSERFGCTDDYGFDYPVDYEDFGEFILRVSKSIGGAG